MGTFEQVRMRVYAVVLVGTVWGLACSGKSMPPTDVETVDEEAIDAGFDALTAVEADAVADVPAADIPSADGPATNTPTADIPSEDGATAETLSEDAPDADAPDADAPDEDAPDADASSDDTLATDLSELVDSSGGVFAECIACMVQAEVAGSGTCSAEYLSCMELTTPPNCELIISCMNDNMAAGYPNSAEECIMFCIASYCVAEQCPPDEEKVKAHNLETCLFCDACKDACDQEHNWLCP